MTTTAKKLYIRRKLQELIQYTENSGLDDGREIAKKDRVWAVCLG